LTELLALIMMQGLQIGPNRSIRQEDGAVAAPAGVVYGLAVALLLTAAYCATRPFTSRLLHRRFEPDVEVTHIVMGPAMAAMLVGRLTGEWSRAVVFVSAAGVAWFGLRLVREGIRARPGGGHPGHQAQHLVAWAAMLYMLTGASVNDAMGMTPAAGIATAPGITRALGLASATRMSSATSASASIEILAIALGSVLVAYAAWDFWAVATSPRRLGPAMAVTGTQRMLAPRMATGCQAVMCLAMGGMIMATL
jgi:Domain of unknown function (DUF5134)